MRLHWVSQPDLALVRTLDLLPHVVLVDHELGQADPTTVIAELAARAPEAAVLALVAPDGMAAASQMVAAGARGFITTPLQEKVGNSQRR